MASFFNMEDVARLLGEFRITGGACEEHELLTAVHMECDQLVLYTRHGEARADELFMALLLHDCEDAEAGPVELELIPELPEGHYEDDEDDTEAEELTYTGPIRDVSTLPDLNNPAIWASSTAGMHAGIEHLLRQHSPTVVDPPSEEAA